MSLQILVVFAFLLGKPHVQTEVLYTDFDGCQRAGNQIVELLKEHKNIKEPSWTCVLVTNIGKES
jgi:hypothetical protein